ncbi:MAG: OadG family protein [Clostridia bacterium]|nr:OadG family protein [Clostridia bacterium]
MDFLFPIALATDMPTWLVCILGVSVVFVGLICIIGILYLMNFLISKTEGKKTEKTTVATPAAPAPAPVAAPIENRREIVAAVCAAVAEEEGTDISAIRVISFKKL